MHFQFCTKVRFFIFKNCRKRDILCILKLPQITEANSGNETRFRGAPAYVIRGNHLTRRDYGSQSPSRRDSAAGRAAKPPLPALRCIPPRRGLFAIIPPRR